MKTAKLPQRKEFVFWIKELDSEDVNSYRASGFTFSEAQNAVYDEFVKIHKCGWISLDRFVIVDVTT